MDASPADPKSTVLVLGGGGFIGSRLVEMLRTSPEFRPIAAPRQRSLVFHRDVEVRVCDATVTKNVSAAMQGVDYVVNCITGPPGTTIPVTQVMCDVARRLTPKRLIYISSLAVYGAATGPVDEGTVPVLPLGWYGTEKLAGEQIILRYVRDDGDAIILRPSCVYGPGSTQWTSRIARLLQAGRIGDLGAGGSGTCNLIYVDDLVRAIMAALTVPGQTGEVFNISDYNLLTWNDYFAKLGAAIGLGSIKRVANSRLVLESRLLAPILYGATMLAKKLHLPTDRIPPAIPPSLSRSWYQDIRPVTDKYSTHLRATHTDFDLALQASAQWFNAIPPTLGAIPTMRP